jgi:hypothetical protein
MYGEFPFFVFFAISLFYVVILIITWVLQSMRGNYEGSVTLMTLAPWFSLLYAFSNVSAAQGKGAAPVLASILAIYLIYRVVRGILDVDYLRQKWKHIHIPALMVLVMIFLAGIKEILVWIVAVLTFILYWKSLRMLQQAIKEIEALERKQKQYS